jgi:hypothetical protein
MFGWIKKVFAPAPQITPEPTLEVEGVVEEIVEVVVEEVKAPEPVDEVVVEVTEPEYTAESLTKLTKLQLESLGREYGIELDRRKRKDTLIKELLEVLV